MEELKVNDLDITEDNIFIIKCNLYKDLMKFLETPE